MLSTAAQSGQAGALCGAPARGRRCRSGRTARVTRCTKKDSTEDNTLMQTGARAAAAAAAAALLLVQGQPAMAATVKKDPFKESQEQAALFEKLIKERSSGGSLFKLKLPESAPVPKEKAGEEVFVPPPPVELKAIPLQLVEPVRETTIEPPPRVPAPEPSKKGSVAAEAVEGLVNIVGGDLPAPPPAAKKPEAPKSFFNFPSPPKAEELPLPKPPSLPSLPNLPKPPSLPKAEELPVPKPPSLPSLPSLPKPPSLPKAEELPVPKPPSLPEAPKSFFNFPSPPKAEELALPKPPSLPNLPKPPSLPKAEELPLPKPDAPKNFFNFPSPPKAEELPKPPSLPNLPKPPSLPKAEELPLPKPPSLPSLPNKLPSLPSLPNLPTPDLAPKADTPTTPPPNPPPSPPQETPKVFGGFFSGPEKAPESTGQAGKPELPQPEPAVTPGDANIVIPESKDVAPEVKVAPPKGDAGPPAPSAPFSFFGGGGSKPEEKAPAAKAEDKLAAPFSFFGGPKPQDTAPAPKEEKPSTPFSFFGASKAGEKTAEEAQSPSMPLPSPVPTPEEVKPKPDDNPFSGLFNSSPSAEPKGPPAPVRTTAQATPAKEEAPAAPFSFFGASKAGEKTAEEAQSPSLPLPSPVPTPEEVNPKPDDNPFAGLLNSSPSAEPKGPPAPVRTTPVAAPAKEEAPAAPFSFFGASKAGEKTAEEAQSPSLPLPSPVPTPEEVKPKPDDNPFAGLLNSSPSAEPKGPPAPVRQSSQAAPAKEEKPDDNPFAGLFASSPAAPVKAAPAAEDGGGAPVWAFFGGIIALAIAAFSSNARNAASFKAAAEEAKKAAEPKALQVAEAAKAPAKEE